MTEKTKTPLIHEGFCAAMRDVKRALTLHERARKAADVAEPTAEAIARVVESAQLVFAAAKALADCDPRVAEYDARVVRLYEFTGSREAVEGQVSRSIHGTCEVSPGVVVTAVTVGDPSDQMDDILRRARTPARPAPWCGGVSRCPNCGLPPTHPGDPTSEPCLDFAVGDPCGNPRRVG